MKKNQDLAQIYDLIEKFNFFELSREEKDFVLGHITEEEYMNLRSTLGDTRRFFSNYPEEGQFEKPSPLKRFFTHRLELYKIAAIFLIALGIGFLLDRAVTGKQTEILAMTDTIYITSPDTVHLIIRDTIEVFKENTEIKAVYPGDRVANKQKKTNDPSDCAQDICPDDLASLNELSRRNNISYNKDLTQFTVTLP